MAEEIVSLFGPDTDVVKEVQGNGHRPGAADCESDFDDDNDDDDDDGEVEDDDEDVDMISNGCSSWSGRSAEMNFDLGVLPPEPQQGNVEYKLKLINPTKQRFEHLVTQMKWRLREGHGEAIYEIGVSDSGHLQGLSDEDMDTSLGTLREMAEKLGASSEILRRKWIDAAGSKSVAEILVRKVPDDQHNIELRVAVLGSNDAGKSTLLGVLTQGSLDNGQGSARLNMFRHMHEIKSGRTSSVSHEILGFDRNGTVINYKYREIITAAEIRNKSIKLVNFLDLAGHRRYMRTTVQALSGYAPHYAIIVIAAGRAINQVTREHLALVQALDVPYFVVITKIDICLTADKIIAELKALLTTIGARRLPLVVTDSDTCMTGSRLLTEPVVPIFCVSSVKGTGLRELLRFLNLLQPGVSKADKERLEQERGVFHIDEIFNVAEVGPVAGGLLERGCIMERCRMQLGPLKDGSFTPVTVQTLHRNKAPCRVVRAGQSASLSFANHQQLPPLRNGMVLLQRGGQQQRDASQPSGSFYFQAKVSVIYHATRIDKGFHTTVHIGSIRQTAIVVGIYGDRKLATDDTESVMFQFLCHPEYITVGNRILFREGAAKGIGVITQVFPVLKADVDNQHIEIEA